MICDFCYRKCDIKNGQSGYCKVRKVIDNKLVSINYSYLEAIAMDPIEKKPLYHFLPGTKSLSVAQAGCNYHCDFCQNWQLSQKGKSTNAQIVSPKELISIALKYKVPSISFTYSEPIIWQDYVMDTAILAKKHGIKTVMVTNGSFSKESREKLSFLIDAFNIDLKGDASYYKEICKGDIKAVLESIKYLVKQDNHVEVTTLLIEGIHTKEIIKDLAIHLKDYGVQVWHLSRFFPNYKMKTRAATSEEFLLKMINEAKKVGIPYIYGGNSSLPSSTICNNCKNILIQNHIDSYKIKKDIESNITNNRCQKCHSLVYGVFN